MPGRKRDRRPPIKPDKLEGATKKVPIRHKKNRLKQCECLSRKKIPGAVLLSHSQIYSTIAAGALNYRVREGNVCFCSAMDAGK